MRGVVPSEQVDGLIKISLGGCNRGSTLIMPSPGCYRRRMTCGNGAGRGRETKRQSGRTDHRGIHSIHYLYSFYDVSDERFLCGCSGGDFGAFTQRRSVVCVF